MLASPVHDPDRFAGHKVRLAGGSGALFDGPLDLLLYLIRANKFDICDFPLREITGQFVEYLAVMSEVEADYVGDFLVTAATLMQIKARMLLPKDVSKSEEVMEESGEIDSRAELVERLLEYERIREAAADLKTLREAREELYGRSLLGLEDGAVFDAQNSESLLWSDVSSFDLLLALRRVLKRLEEAPVALIEREPFSLPERLKGVSARLYHDGEVTFEGLCHDCQSRLEIVITFLAILELIRRGKARVRQLTLFDEIWLEKT